MATDTTPLLARNQSSVRATICLLSEAEIKNSLDMGTELDQILDLVKIRTREHGLLSYEISFAYTLVNLMKARKIVIDSAEAYDDIWAAWSARKRASITSQNLEGEIDSQWAEYLNTTRTSEELETVLWAPFKKFQSDHSRWHTPVVRGEGFKIFPRLSFDRNIFM